MKISTPVLVLLAALALPAVAQQQQTIWRCGADGRSYSTAPCAGGRALEPVVAPSAAEQRSAQRTAVIDERLAAQMHKDRLRREAAASQRTALAGFRTTVPGPVAKAAPKKARQHRRPEAAGTWRATAPSSRRAEG